MRVPLLLLGFLVSSCQIVGNDPPESIIHENGVWDLEFGMTSTEVRDIVGVDSDGGGWVDGFGGRFWFLRYYPTKEVGRIGVYHLAGQYGGVNYEETQPADVFIMREGFTGKTRRGVKIGSDRALVEAVYGEPIRTVGDKEDRSWQATYCLGRKDLTVYYDDDEVSLMSLGFFYLDDFDGFGLCNTSD